MGNVLMPCDEFELRYMSFLWMSNKFKLNWDDDMLVNLVRITDKWQLDHSLQETSPDDLKHFTEQTYTPFKKDTLEKLQDIFPGKDPRFSLSNYIERLEYELKVIKEMGFNSYFLVVSDYVRWAKNNQISVGPGRGSGAGSVLARFIQITDVDPLPFDLLFERFLNPARISMPDFDIDFEDTLRQHVIDYVTEKYGAENVCSIGTFMKMASKAAFKDAARTLGVPFEKSNYVSNLLQDKGSLLEMVTTEEGNEELKNFYETDERVKKAIEFWHKLTGNMRQLGVHACGIIIAPDKVTHFTPTQYNKENDHTIVSQYDWPTLEYIWLLKMDFLGLRNLSIIKNCIKILKARSDISGEAFPEMFQHYLDTMSFEPPLNDDYTYEKVFKEGDTTGIFQFESAGMRRFLIQLEPTLIDNIVAMAALYRPGPMEFIPSYIERRHGKEEIEYLYPELREELIRKYGVEVAEEERRKLIEDLDPIMKDTYGIAVYQEQLMFLVQAMAGFSLWEADVLRRWVGKKKKEIIEQIKQEFIIKGASHRNYKPETTKQIYEKMIEPAASYSFNKSHAVCYALIAYQTAYLKAHYPVEFYAALIRSVEEDTDTQSFYISEIQQHGIIVNAPDVNISFNHVAAIDDSIRIWFMSIKGVGFEVWEFIQKERQDHGRFSSLEDFCKRCWEILNKKSLEGIIKSWALDQFYDRKVLWNNLEIILDWIKNSANADQGLFGGMETFIELKKTESSTLMERLMMEQEAFKSFISGNPLDGLYKYIKKFTFLSQVKDKSDIGQFVIIGYIKNIQRAKKKWFFIKIEDITDDWEFFTSDPCWLEKFDVVIVHGFWTTYENKKTWEKRQRLNVSKIIKTTHEKLKSLAGGSYSLDDTVVSVKKARYGEQKQLNLEKIRAQTLITSTEKADLKQSIEEGDSFEELESSISPEELEEQILESEEIDTWSDFSDSPLVIEDEHAIDEHNVIGDEEQDDNFEPEITTSQQEEEEDIDTSALLEHAKEILNESIDPTLPFVIETSQLKTIDDMHYVANLVKSSVGNRTVIIMGKEFQVSDEVVEKLRAFLGL